MDDSPDSMVTSLRRQLLTWLLGLLMLVGILGGVGTYLVALNEPNEDFDNQMRQLAFYIGEGAGQSYAQTKEAKEFEPEDAILVQIWNHTGQPVRLSDPSMNVPRQTRTGFADIEAAGHSWRTYTLIGLTRTVQISQRTEIRRDLATKSAIRVVYPIAALIPLSSILFVYIVSGILRPLRNLTDELAGRQAGTHRPLALLGLPREVTPLVAAVNALLQRQQELLDFRQRFLADAAHQLRTPLTAARLQASNLVHAAASSDLRDLSRDIGLGLKRMSAMVDQLLRLARADEPDRARPTQPYDLADIAGQAISDMLALADQRSIDIGMTRRASATIICDREEIRMLVCNILDNAIRYTPPGGDVDVALDVTSSGVTISVSDTGPGVLDQDIPKLFGRFIRLGTADVEGSGLGLAIVQAIAIRHGADVIAENRPGQKGLRVSVVFPRPDTD